MENEMRRKILHNVDDLKDEMIQVLSELVRIESVTPKLEWDAERSEGKESRDPPERRRYI